MDGMKLHELYNPIYNGLPMRVACFMSGSGTNARKIIEYQNQLGKDCPYEVAVIFSDTWNSRATEIGKDYDLPVVMRDINSFYEKRGKKKWYFVKNRKADAWTREEFDEETVKAISPYKPKAVALCGYMSAVSKPILNAFLGINVHPADLSIREDGKRKFTGLHAVKDAILAGEKYLYSTTHIVRETVDYGEILMRSKALEVQLPIGFTLEELMKVENKDLLDGIVDEYQDRLKEIGDWVIFPKTLEMIAEGRFALDDNNNMYVDGVLMPNGYRL